MRFGLTVWEPIKGFDPFGKSFDRLFEESVRALSPNTSRDSEQEAWSPKVDIYEDDDRYILKADLPGLNKEDIQVDLNDNTLRISGEKKNVEKTSKDNYVRLERKYGKFVRSFTVSDNIDTQNIKANYKDGVLEVTLPKKEEAKPKQLKVHIN